MSEKPVIIDLDDLVDEQQIIEHILPLKDACPELRLTLYGIPNRLGPVHELKKRYDWITFGIHGWEHTFCECCSWTQEETELLIQCASQMGYAPLFKPPNWRFDTELTAACAKLGIVLHHLPKDDPGRTHGLRAYPGPAAARGFLPKHARLHSHISPNPVTDWIGNHPGFKPEKWDYTEFLTPLDLAMEISNE